MGEPLVCWDCRRFNGRGGGGDREMREIDLNWARRNEMNSPGGKGRKGCPSRGREQ